MIEGTSMDALYENFVRQVAGSKLSELSGTLKEDIAISQEQEALQKEIAALKKRLSSERQPQKKFMLHKQLKELEKKII
jgi:molecular chaperone GrpE (heat shock protein)